MPVHIYIESKIISSSSGNSHVRKKKGASTLYVPKPLGEERVLIAHSGAEVKFTQILLLPNTL